MDKKKIIIVTTVPQTIYYILENQPSFLKQHYEVELVTSPGIEVSLIQKREKVKIHTIEMQRKISPLKDFFALIRLVFLFLKIRPDCVHSYTPKAGLLSMASAYLIGVKIRIHTFTGLVFPSRKGIIKKLLIFTDKLTAFFATMIVAESEGVKEDLKSKKITPHNIDIIGSGNIAGVDEQFYSPSSKELKLSSRLRLGLPDDVFVFCYVGRLNPEKGIPELIRAFSSLDSNAYLLIAGIPDPSYPLDSKTLDLIECNSKILNLKSLHNAKIIFSASDVNILPSHREGFSNVLLEACSMGIPSIATDVNGSREIIRNNETGWLIPIKNELALKEALEMSLKSYNLSELGENCRNEILKKFKRKDYLQKLLNFYKKL